MKPVAHPTLWTLIVTKAPSEHRLVRREIIAGRFKTQAEAELARDEALTAGERGFVQPPLAAWAGKY